MFGIELTPEHRLDRIADLGRLAQDVGFDTAFVSCHYFNRDPFVALDRIARQTGSIRLGPGVANPYETHPVTLASRVASLQETSGGRAVFGIGPGDPSSLGALGLSEERGLRSVLESFKIAQRLWAGETVSHEGAFEVNDADLKFDVDGSIPVYVGGEGPHMCRMSAKHADGLLFNGSHPDDLAWARDQVEQGLEDRPDSRGEFELAAYAAVSIAEDADQAREAARPPVAFITAGAAPPVLDRHGIDAGAAETVSAALSENRFRDAYDAVTPTMVEAFCMAGTPATVADRMAAVLEHADGLVVGSPLGPELERAVELAGEAATLAGAAGDRSGRD
jgi:5,10-methylenetetrahydromethanopterin reductase